VTSSWSFILQLSWGSYCTCSIRYLSCICMD